MRRAVLLSSAALLLAPFLGAENLPKLIRRVRPAVATVHTYDSRGGDLVQGSGFFITREGALITARHVVKEAARILVTTWDGRNWPATVAGEDAENDVALLAVQVPRPVSTLPVRPGLPDVGESILVVGSPLGFSDSASDGIVSAVRQVDGIGLVLQMTAPISSGSSGSPVLNRKGQVIAIARSQRDEGQNLNFAVPADAILKLASTPPLPQRAALAP